MIESWLLDLETATVAERLFKRSWPNSLIPERDVRQKIAIIQNSLANSGTSGSGTS
jgi:hypothetical protein